MRNHFSKWPSGAPLHTLSKLYNVPVGFVTPLPILRLRIAYLWSPKVDCCSISDDLSCSSKHVLCYFTVYRRNETLVPRIKILKKILFARIFRHHTQRLSTSVAVMSNQSNFLLVEWISPKHFFHLHSNYLTLIWPFYLSIKRQ